ncbi:MAG: putative selenate ABC transporter substrate-binding protein [Planctomycetota bacterium]|jgi:phosphonate transport system substrate-binding protein
MRWTLLLTAFLFVIGCDKSEPAGGDADSTNAGCGGGAAEKVFYFTAIPDQNTTELKAKYDPVAAYLSKELSVTVKYRASADYGASVEMFKNGDVHLAWFGGLTGCQARAAVDGARAIAQGKEDPNFISYFIANTSTGLQPSADFPMGIGKLTFAFGSEKSTSGRLMPEFYIRKHTGKSPREFFSKQPQFSGSHDKTIEMVAAGSVQAGVLNYKVYEKRTKQVKDIDPDVAVIVWKTPPYADYNFTAHPELDTMFGDGFIEKLQNALVAMDDANLLNAFGRSALIPAENKDFDGIAATAKELGLLR